MDSKKVESGSDVPTPADTTTEKVKVSPVVASDEVEVSAHDVGEADVHDQEDQVEDDGDFDWDIHGPGMSFLNTPESQKWDNNVEVVVEGLQEAIEQLALDGGVDSEKDDK